jgi:multidrug efflux pump subunit AcrA (membrane-fusion protein)
MGTKFLYAALVCLTLLGGCASKPSSAVADRRDIVGLETFESELIVPATDQAAVMPTYRAPVEKVMATVGAVVKRGDVLIQLSFPNAEAAYEQAQAGVKAAEANLAEAKKTYDEVVDMWQTRVLDMRAAKNSGAEVDPAELASAERELADAQRDRTRGIAPYSEAVVQAQQMLAQTKSGAKLASIRAPIYGTVLEMNARPGEVVGEDREERIAFIVDLDALQVHAIIPASRKVDDGDMFVISFKDVPNEQFEGKVTKVVTVAGGDGARRAIIDFENKKGLVKPGMASTASMETGKVENVVAVPTDAVDKDDTGKPIVHILKGDEWVATVVEVGLSGGGYTEIKSGVAEGDTVQVTP